MNGYSAEADEHFININLSTEMELPNNRDTVLHFYEQMSKAFPDLQNFYSRENEELVLEGDKEKGTYRWLAIEPRRLCSGHVNPASPEEAFRQHEMVLELAPHLLTLSILDCEALDLMYGFDFNYRGNHDEIVVEALGLGTGLEGVLEAGGTTLDYEPSLTLALDPSCRLQARVAIETRTSAMQVRTGEFSDDQISVYFTVRQYWSGASIGSFVESLRRQREIAEKYVDTAIIPRIVRPMAQAIASR